MFCIYLITVKVLALMCKWFMSYEVLMIWVGLSRKTENVYKFWMNFNNDLKISGWLDVEQI
jgi:hypothetical protein